MHTATITDITSPERVERLLRGRKSLIERDITSYRADSLHVTERLAQHDEVVDAMIAWRDHGRYPDGHLLQTADLPQPVTGEKDAYDTRQAEMVEKVLNRRYLSAAAADSVIAGFARLQEIDHRREVA